MRAWGLDSFYPGPLLLAGAGVMAVVAVAALGSLLDPGTIDQLWNFVLLPIAPLALLSAAYRSRTNEIGVFFAQLAFAYAAWLLAGMLQFALEDAPRTPTLTLVRDCLYGLYYVGLLWAIEWARRARAVSIAEKLIALVGSLLLVGGALVYLEVLPTLAGADRSRVPYLLLFVGLDLYIAARLALLARKADLGRTRLVYGLIAVSALSVSVAEGIEVAIQLELLPTPSAPWPSAVWVVPFAPLLLATHLRRPELPEPPPLSRHRGSPVVWSPLVAYGFLLPSLHVALYTSGAGDPSIERARGYFVVCWLLAVALLVLLERAAKTLRIRSTEQALTDAYSRIRELSRSREKAAEDERRRLSRELHDGLGQALLALKADVARLASSGSDEEDADSRRLERASARAADVLEAARRLASGLRPGSLDDLGLVAALEDLVAATAEKKPAVVRLIAAREPPGLDAEDRVALYRTVEEWVTSRLDNGSVERIEIEVSEREDGTLELSIVDDGSPRSVRGGSAPELDLLSAQERAEALGGKLELLPGLRGRGVTLRVRVPRSESPGIRRKGWRSYDTAVCVEKAGGGA